MVFPEKMRGIKKQIIIPACLKRGSIIRWIPAFAGMTLLLNVISCSKTNLNQPPVIRYGKDHCAECRMMINEESFASAIIKNDGEIVKFDDIGCLIRFRTRSGSNEIKKIWVHDYTSGNWIETGSATGVHTPELVTPMGYSLAAFRDTSEAKRWASEKHGEIINLNDYQIH